MSVEAAISIGSSVSVGPSLNARFGPRVTGPEFYAPTIINEGSVAPKFLENSVTLARFNPVGEIKFNSPAEKQVAIEPLQAVDRTRIDAIVHMYGVGTKPLIVPTAAPKEWVYPPQIATAPEPATKLATAQQAQAVSTQPAAKEQEVEEVLEKKVTADKTDILEEEEIDRVKRKYVVDERALSQVVLEIKGAVRKAKELAGKLGIKITGELIGKFIPGQNLENESEVVKGKGPDGSIPERQQAIEELGEFSSDVYLEERAVKLAYEKPPIKIRTEGAPVSNEDVQRVYKNHLTKPKAVVEIITRKIIKKKKLAAQLGQKTIETAVQIQVSENKIEDQPQLVDVFQIRRQTYQKAA